MSFVLHGNKLYQEIDAGEFTAYAEVPVTAYKDQPVHRRLQGLDIPVWLVDQIKAFFLWSPKDEVCVQLWYHAEHGWRAAPLPQKSNGGMTVTFLNDHENYIPTHERMTLSETGQRQPGWEKFGTWHHHCSASAFASGVDTNDEKSKEGIHLTTGNLDKDEFTTHARVSFRGVIAPAVLSDWFESVLGEQRNLLSQALVDHQLHHELNQRPPDGTVFPDWWKDNVVHVVHAATTFQYRNSAATYSSPHGSNSYVGSRSSADEWCVYKGVWMKKSDIPGGKAEDKGVDSEAFKNSLGMALDSMNAASEDDRFEMAADLIANAEWFIDLAHQHNVSADDMIKALAKLDDRQLVLLDKPAETKPVAPTPGGGFDEDEHERVMRHAYGMYD